VSHIVLSALWFISHSSGIQVLWWLVSQG